MSDFGDDAATAQERHLKRSLARMGIQQRDIQIPPPNYAPEPSPAGGPCSHQIDKGKR